MSDDDRNNEGPSRDERETEFDKAEARGDQETKGEETDEVRPDDPVKVGYKMGVVYACPDCNLPGQWQVRPEIQVVTAGFQGLGMRVKCAECGQLLELFPDFPRVKTTNLDPMTAMRTLLGHKKTNNNGAAAQTIQLVGPSGKPIIS